MPRRIRKISGTSGLTMSQPLHSTMGMHSFTFLGQKVRNHRQARSPILECSTVSLLLAVPVTSGTQLRTQSGRLFRASTHTP